MLRNVEALLKFRVDVDAGVPFIELTASEKALLLPAASELETLSL